MTDIKSKLREGLMKEPTRLYVWDFDGTLVDTGLPETHKPIWKEKTGTEWPHKGWWGRKESLDPIFDHQPIPSVVSAYNKAKGDADGIRVMLTGRRTKLKGEVKAILDKHGLVFDKYLLNYGGDTLSNKIEQLGNLLKEYPSIVDVLLWDDRKEHIATFEQWGKGLVESGRLKDFGITVVPSPNHE